MKQSANWMRRLKNWVLIAGATATLAGCYVVPVNPSTGQPYPVTQQAVGVAVAAPIDTSTVLQAKLYPLNVQATKAGPLIATAIDGNNGRGTFSLTFMGELLQGDASRVDAGYPSFGRIYREVLGSATDVNRGGRRGIANAFGTNGTNVQCEYHMTSKDVGTGVCLFSNGARYQMHFGS